MKEDTRKYLSAYKPTTFTVSWKTPVFTLGNSGLFPIKIHEGNEMSVPFPSECSE